MTAGPLEKQVEAIIASLAEHQDETLRAIRARDELVLDAVTAAAGPDARPTEKWVAVVDLILQAAFESLAIAAEGDRVDALEGETRALNSARALDRATRALLEGEQHRFIEEMQAAEATIVSVSR